MEADIFDLSPEQPCTVHDVINCPDCIEKALQEEKEYFLQKCGSCLNFKPFLAEAGFCKIAECNCLCKNPDAMIDIWKDKCEKWVVNPLYL